MPVPRRPLTRVEREGLRRLIDERRRQLVQAEDASENVSRCRGCGCELVWYSEGCQVCHARKWARARRGTIDRTPVASWVEPGTIIAA